jgi:hypothetical protein
MVFVSGFWWLIKRVAWGFVPDAEQLQFIRLLVARVVN